MTPQIKLFLLLVIFSVVAAPHAMAEGGVVDPSAKSDEPAESLPKNDEGEPVAKTTVEEPSEPVRTVQIPVFQNGKWKGYREEALEPERKPASENTIPETSTEGNGAVVPETPASPPSQ